MKTGLGLTAAVVAFALLIFATAAGADGRYADATGDGNGAPDIQNVQVTNDGNGLITFRITTDALPPAPADVATVLAIDADVNESTGAPGWPGSDYAFEVDQADQHIRLRALERLRLGKLAHATVSISESSTTLAISVNQSDLGSTDEFNFWVLRARASRVRTSSTLPPTRATGTTRSPRNGQHIKGLAYTLKPKAPKHGKPFSFQLAGVRVPEPPPRARHPRSEAS